MLIDLRKPQLKVKLRKNIGRKNLDGNAAVSARFSGQAREVDLTPFLGEGASVRITKSIHEPAGAFSITVPDKIDMDLVDSLYSAIEPMDIIEIRISGAGYQAKVDAGGMTQNQSGDGVQSFPLDPGQDFPPVMMRGFVSQVQRMLGMASDGKPSRQVVISGQDYGKLLQINQQFFMPNAPDTANILTGMPFFAKFGNFDNRMEIGHFMRELFGRVVNPYVANMSAQSQSPIQQFLLDIQVSDSIVSPFGVGGWGGGTITDLIRTFGDIGPWNEFFIEDRFDGPYAVYRPNPFMDAVTGDFIQPTDARVVVTDLDQRDVISMSSARSDANVANYFWVDSPRFLLVYESDARALAFQSAQVTDAAPFYVQDYGNVNPTLYGSRKMEETTNQGGGEETNNGNGTKADTSRIQNRMSALEWINLRRKQLYLQNKDNILFETGSMRIKGNESVRAGTYVRLAHGNMRSFYYVVSVSHTFTPFGNYLTELQFERGTGFVDRVQAAAGQAYYDETVTTT